MQQMKEKIIEADKGKLCAFQIVRIREHKEYFFECKFMYASKNPIWTHECKIDLCPMFQTWKLLETDQTKERLL